MFTFFSQGAAEGFWRLIEFHVVYGVPPVPGAAILFNLHSLPKRLSEPSGFSPLQYAASPRLGPIRLGRRAVAMALSIVRRRASLVVLFRSASSTR